MDTLEYKGELYRRYTKKWVDSGNKIVHETLQRELNMEYVRNSKIAVYSIEECIQQGDKLKKSGSPGLALRLYEEAFSRADKNAIRQLLPRITSCHRENNHPQKAIDLIEDVKRKYGNEIISAALLTSVGAACCDVEDYTLAKKYCDRAYAMTKGRYNIELSLVYQRIKKATE